MDKENIQMNGSLVLVTDLACDIFVLHFLAFRLISKYEANSINILASVAIKLG